MTHTTDHLTTTVLRDGNWFVFCYSCQRDIEPFHPNGYSEPPDTRPELIVWFHESEEICEHDAGHPWPCEVMADHLLRAFTVTPRLIENSDGTVSFEGRHFRRLAVSGHSEPPEPRTVCGYCGNDPRSVPCPACFRRPTYSEPPEPLPASVRVLGHTIDQLRVAVATASLHDPGWVNRGEASQPVPREALVVEAAIERIESWRPTADVDRWESMRPRVLEVLAAPAHPTSTPEPDRCADCGEAYHGEICRVSSPEDKE